MPAGRSEDSSLSRTQITSPRPWMSLRSSPSQISKMKIYPTGFGEVVLTNMPEVETLAEYSMEKPPKSWNLRITLRSRGTRFETRGSDSTACSEVGFCCWLGLITPSSACFRQGQMPPIERIPSEFRVSHLAGKSSGILHKFGNPAQKLAKSELFSAFGTGSC